ncbi:MAG: hypothetical protein PHQ66_01870 [Candidatus Nanoarchaeia archaeon]|nr:hypothetical protein [Candidatus Nanoarchaeia archaeon]MDD5357878.1 hypothetical protein [Candidatus Nanoarchaeia archaeon]MDD5588797.1 hypothetical protein [Candidatus Nanoarchaeia archaeon]
MTDEPPRELLADVIINTIYIDNIAEDIIDRFFGFKQKFWSEKNIDEEKIRIFNKYFFQNAGIITKLRIVREIIKRDYPKIKFPKDFDNKVDRFYKIRNIFAHNIALKGTEKKYIPKTKELNWENLHKEHGGIYDYLVGIIMEGAVSILESETEV